MYKSIIKIIVIVLVVSLVALPIDTKAKTISEFEAEMNKYSAELQAKKDRIAKNDAEVAQIKKKIAEIENQIATAKEEITKLEKEIEESNKEIENKKEQSKKIMKYFQIVNGENSYLEYIFEAVSITDMIYRVSIVEQLTDYNQKVVKELTELIEKNNKQKKELETKNVELKDLQKSLESEKERINADTKATRDTMPSLEDQIKAAKENISYFKKLGCGKNEDVQSCSYRVNQSGSASVPSSGSTLRPITTGTRQGGLYSYSGHTGQDMTSPNKKNETIYPIANGYVLSVYNDNCYSFCGFNCNGNANIVVIRHNINNQYIYGTYVHLSQVYVSKGQQVSAYTPIGKMGNTGCTSGSDPGGTSIHLHLELATCHWQPGGGCSWGTYQNRILNPRNYVTFPSSWNNR